jgi:hypothetical protein
MKSSLPCPSCRSAMEALPVESGLGIRLQIDACWACHLFWFDKNESASLSANAVIDLFRRIHEAEMRPAQSRKILSTYLRCPTCTSGLKLTNDMQRGGRFTYHRCASDHGRASTFTQFLREKNFIRSLSQMEIQSLSATVKQIRCSSCGAPIHLEKDNACGHCGAAIAVLDGKAVEKALDAWSARQKQPPSAERLGDAVIASWETGRPPAKSSGTPPLTPSRNRKLADVLNAPPAASNNADLISIGIGVLVDAIFR